MYGSRSIILYIKIFDILGIRMQFAQEKVLIEENQGSNLKALKEVEYLEKEEESLIQQKEELIEVEQQLWNRVSFAIQTKRKRNKELKEEIEQLRRRCEELVEALNSSNLSGP
jgi:hypothetical protein